MPGLEGDLEEWQTQEVNVTRGDEGDIDLEGLPFLKVTRGPRHYLFCYSRQFYYHADINADINININADINIHWFSFCEMTDSHTPGLHVNFYDELQKLIF